MQLNRERTARIEAIDIARALAVLGVVFNHSVDGLLAARIMSDGSFIADLNGALYMVRMPALAFVLGLFLPRASEKRGVRGYIREKVVFATYIYVVWFMIQTVVEIATSSLKNSPREMESLFAVWSMPAHLWFMPYLAVSAVVLGLTAPWRTTARGFVVLLVLAIGSILAWGWNPAIFGLRGLCLLAFTGAGALIGAQRLGVALTLQPIAWMFSGAAALSGFILLLGVGVAPGTVPQLGYYGFGESAVSAVTAGLGIIVLLAFAVFLSHIPKVRGIFRSFGTKTLEIYLAHVIVVAGTRIALVRLGLESETVFLTIAMIFGVGAPVIMAILTPRLRLSWLFCVPGALGRWSRAANKNTAVLSGN